MGQIKRPLITDASGVPLAAIVTGGNRHDVTQLIGLVEAIPPDHRPPRETPRHRPGPPALARRAHLVRREALCCIPG
ncbi:hypothetical protein Franean1_4362 [Parafrankia sp. EAN1pec]|nr:hypothetical protein Franean1_4362 [Frankia sp. EAN1pec]